MWREWQAGKYNAASAELDSARRTVAEAERKLKAEVSTSGRLQAELHTATLSLNDAKAQIATLRQEAVASKATAERSVAVTK